MPFNLRPINWLSDARRDMRHAARLLRRHPAVTITATLSLAIGIGANTTVFTIANALLFQPPPGVVEPSRLVDIGRTRSGAGFGPSSYPDYLDVRQRATTLDHVYAYSRFPQAVSVGGAGNGAPADSIFVSVVTVNYFTALGAVPAAGRLFDAGDSDRPGANPVVVLGHAFWTRRFTADPAILGRTLTLNGHPVTVVGVAPADFHGTGVRALDAWVPMGLSAAVASQGTGTLTDRSRRWLLLGGRLKPDVTNAQAAAEMDVIGKTLEREYQEQNRLTGLRVLASSPVPGNGGPLVAFLVLFMAIVSIVLIVACANVAGVLLARATARRQEMALRVAIGAGRAQLIRQLLTETMLLFVLGGVTGLALARAMTSVLTSRLPTLPFPVSLSLTLDGRVIAVTTGLSLLAALLAGLAPAVEASRASVVSGLRNDMPRVGRLRVRHAFVICQVAFSVVLMVVAGLFVRALQRAGSIDPGFDSHGVELVSIELAPAGYTDATGPRFAVDLLDRVRRLPGVRTATIASSTPGGFEVWREALRVPDRSSSTSPDFVTVDWNVIASEYFATLRTPIVAGRDFTSEDRDGTPSVAIVSESAARRFWPGQSAIGKPLLQPTWSPQGPTGPWRTLLVVGVSGDIHSTSAIDGLGGDRVYVPFQQHYVASVTIAARTTGGQRLADELRALLASTNPDVPVATMQTLDDAVAFGFMPQRAVASVAGSLGLVGLLLTGIGIYGVMAYAVTRRTREIGIRIALGARRGDVVRMVLREGLSLVAIGLTIGVAIAAGVSRVLAGFLFGIPPADPVTFGWTAVFFATIGMAACYLPVRHATRIEPTQALRYE
jgi:putative ABC transport system permease protein